MQRQRQSPTMRDFLSYLRKTRYEKRYSFHKSFKHRQNTKEDLREECWT